VFICRRGSRPPHGIYNENALQCFFKLHLNSQCSCWNLEVSIDKI
jgi:hypothetical protein